MPLLHKLARTNLPCSLGSVIAYDILRHYWHETNGKIDVTGIDFSKVESYVGSNGAPEFEGAAPYKSAIEYRRYQREAWRHLNRATPSGVKLSKSGVRARWLVTDLITAGSPLSHAPVLLASGIRDLELKRKLRELPTCPPDRSRHLNPGHFTVQLSAEADRIKDYKILPQGAYFALTRWTNFYFSNDPVGGPVAPPFGSAIDDICLTAPTWNPIRSHISYWDAQKTKDAIVRIKSILIEDENTLQNS